MTGELPELVFLGAGQIAEALIRGVLRAGLCPPAAITATDVRPARLEALGREFGIRTLADNHQAVSQGGVVFLTVKPQDLPAVLDEVGHVVGREQLVVSVAAGVPIARIEARLPARPPVIRVMPNTPCLVGRGMAVLALGARANAEHEALVTRIFQAVGRALTLPERHLDAVTALSGSGPAFIALVCEALADAGVRVGLPRDVALTLAAQTVLGTGELLAAAGIHPARAKEMVTSPGGTAIAGIHALERAGVRAAFIDAVVAATERSIQLGREA